MELRDALGALPLAKVEAGRDAASIDTAARRIEGEFARMLIKSMRTTSLGDGDALFPGAAGQYRDLYDGQLADAVTQGKGLGLADMIRRQLGAQAGLDATAASPGPMPLQRDAARAPMPLSTGGLPSYALSAPQAPRAPSAPVAPHVPGASATWPKTDDWSAPQPAQTVAKNAKATQAERFVAEIWPLAKQAAAQLGVDPKTLVAQAALETGWGRKPIPTGDGGSAHNLFGIKAGGRWRGASATTGTTEFVDGVARRESASFRAYGSNAESFADYVRLLTTSPRYAQALEAGTDGRRYAQALQKAGYATDPHYADKLVAIAEGPTLRRALAGL